MQDRTQDFARGAGSLISRMRTASLFGLLVLMCAGSAIAQVSTATVNGVIRDPKGAVIQGATVTLTSIETTVQHPTVSNNAGEYVLLNIAPGRYVLSASASGFNPQKTAEFVLAVSQTATFDFALSVGTATQVVTVDASATQLDVSGASLGTVIETKQVNELPLDGRNFTALLALTPGVVPIMTGQSNGMSGSGGFGAAVAIGLGLFLPVYQRTNQSQRLFLLDGLYNYSAIESTYAVSPIIDAIQEFKVVSHTDSAEFGGVLGGVVNVVTKSGTNDLHGTAWEYLRNKALRRNSPFCCRACLPSEPVWRGGGRSSVDSEALQRKKQELLLWLLSRLPLLEIGKQSFVCADRCRACRRHRRQRSVPNLQSL